MKTFIITGANGNLGTACVKTFLAEGYKVIAVDGNNNHLGFADANTHYEFASVNLGREEETTAFIEGMTAKYKKIDGALLLVGGFATGDLAATTGADIQKMFALNFETAYFMVRPLLQHMQQQQYGRLVFIGARPALLAVQGKDLLAYALSKSLLFKLAECINEAYKGQNITATVVVPSTLDTALNRSSMPGADPANWVTPAALSEIMAFIVSGKGNVLRESVIKVYNNA
ncbi:MAG: SDR family NAD(P)-dependent oxidoreductase [Bacteroidota bacterium]